LRSGCERSGTADGRYVEGIVQTVMSRVRGERMKGLNGDGKHMIVKGRE